MIEIQHPVSKMTVEQVVIVVFLVSACVLFSMPALLAFWTWAKVAFSPLP